MCIPILISSSLWGDIPRTKFPQERSSLYWSKPRLKRKSKQKPPLFESGGITQENMQEITAIIERGTDGGFAIRAEEIPGVIGYGLSEEEAKTDFLEVREEQAEYYQERKGESPWWANASVTYRYDLAAFFQAFPFINATEFARYIGINPSLMRKYKQGLVTASEKQRTLIHDKLAQIIQQMQLVQL